MWRCAHHRNAFLSPYEKSRIPTYRSTFGSSAPEKASRNRRNSPSPPKIVMVLRQSRQSLIDMSQSKKEGLNRFKVMKASINIALWAHRHQHLWLYNAMRKFWVVRNWWRFTFVRALVAPFVRLHWHVYLALGITCENGHPRKLLDRLSPCVFCVFEEMTRRHRVAALYNSPCDHCD